VFLKKEAVSSFRFWRRHFFMPLMEFRLFLLAKLLEGFVRLSGFLRGLGAGGNDGTGGLAHS